MRKVCKDGFPVIPAFLLLLVVIMIDLLGIVSLEQRDRFERISNITMIIIAIAGLLRYFYEQKSDEKRQFYIFSNMTVSVSALCMNVYVFQHTIRPECLWEDVRDAHLLWLLVATVQILLLSGVGKAFFNSIHALLKEVKNIVRQPWEAVCTLIKHADHYVLFAIFTSFIGWSIYIGIQIYINGINYILEDTVVFRCSIWFWIASLLIFLLIRLFPLGIQKAAEGIKEIKVQR